jgi:glycerophosphoryl diester phosphodiesterase
MRVRLGLALLCFAGASSAQCLDLQGHRGARGVFPENTMPAFRYAIEQKVTTLEFDLGMSRDGVLVVTHDPQLNPQITRDASGRWISPPGAPIRSLSAAQIENFDVGRIDPVAPMKAQWPEQVSVDGAKIPRLSEVLALAALSTVRLNIETKINPLDPARTASPKEFAEVLVDQLRRSGLLSRTTVQSFDWRSLKEVKALEPGLRTACLTGDAPNFSTMKPDASGASPWHAGLRLSDHDSVPAMVKAAGCSVWSPLARNLDPALLKQAHALGLQVIPWTVNDVDSMKALAAMGVDGLITDYPKRWIDARSQDQGLRPVCEP